MCMWHVGSGYRYLFAARFFSRVFFLSPFSARLGVGMSSNGLACHLRGSCLCEDESFDRMIWVKRWENMKAELYWHMLVTGMYVCTAAFSSSGRFGS